MIYPRATSRTHAALRDPQMVLLQTARGVVIDVEIFVNCQYGYDIQCEVVGETGIAKLPEPSNISVRLGAQLATPILTDWKDRFVAAYDVELADFLAGCRNNCIGGPSAWDGFAAAVACDACVDAQNRPGPVAISLPEQPALYSARE